MTANKYNSILGEIIHLAAQAELSDDDGVKRLALGDIAAAVANVVPVDWTAQRPSLPGGTRSVASDEPQGLAKFLTLAPGVTLVRFAGNDEIKLVARRVGSSCNPNTIFSIDVDKNEKIGYVWRDGRLLFEIKGISVNYSMIEKCAVSALRRWFKNQRKNNAERRRKRKARLGILTPEQELARTVAEQKEGL